MDDFEKLGLFYLGKPYDPVKKAVVDEYFLYDAKNFTTHAVCVGMTGSGKTGLGIALLEEAGIDRIPAIIVDPKGDLGDLLLTFPDLSAKAFQPWIDTTEAERKGLTPEAYAESIAKTWHDGLTKWGQDGERIRNLRNSVEMTIYTPANHAGVPLSILSSFEAPSKEQAIDTGAIRDRIISLTSSLLNMLGINADPIKSREHILIATIIDQEWKNGRNVDLGGLIQKVQKPPFDKIGALDLDTFFPQKERMALSISLNNLLASPGFQAWMEGVPLDISRLLYTDAGKPRLSIISIAHLSDSERMFFVTLLLNQLLSWMRKQPGTSSLRALFYMDEIYGFFPPTAAPPSKVPMLTLLKQARAFGLGIILATQNPVDLDYKGLSNCGTWFIGKLQTERDKARVLEGLNAASNGELDATALDKLIAATGNRIFLMRSIYEKEPILFETRWAMSYLRGPLTLAQISSLTDKSALPNETIQPMGNPMDSEVKAEKPSLPPNIEELFFRREDYKLPVHYQPLLAGFGKLHYVDSKNKIDTWQEICYIVLPEPGGKSVDWEKGKNLPDTKKQLDKSPLPDSVFDELPSGLMQEKNYQTFAKSLALTVYQNESLSIFQYPSLGMVSKENESENDFRTRIAITLREERDEQVQKLKDKYVSKISALNEKIRKAQTKVEQQKQQATTQKGEAYLSVGATILGAILGKKRISQSTISSAGTSMRRMGKISKENQEATQAEENYHVLTQQLQELQNQLNQEIAQIPSGSDPRSIQIDTVQVKPRKSDIIIDKVAIIWWPT